MAGYRWTKPSSFTTSEGGAPSVLWTPYLTFVGSVTSWVLNSGQYGVTLGLKANSVTPNTWIIDKIQKSSNVFHRIGTTAKWRYVSGNTSLTQ